jgi:hypothetical protein
MKTYLPKIASLCNSHGIWRVESAWMDQIDEAYYLGADFDGRNDCYFYYMVWHDADIDVWNVGYNVYGQVEVPFSKMRCVVIARHRGLREALQASESHAAARLNASQTDATPARSHPTLETPFTGSSPGESQAPVSFYS